MYCWLSISLRTLREWRSSSIFGVIVEPFSQQNPVLAIGEQTGRVENC
jgi:hypothetical protein